MIWTTAKPTRPGWYWMRGWYYYNGSDSRKLNTHVVEVVEEEGRLKAILTKESAFGAVMHDIIDDHGARYEWAGPIELPTGGLGRAANENRDKLTMKFPT